MQNISQLNWSPVIGDPTFIGWFITISYFIAALFAARLYLKSHTLFRPAVIKQQKYFWLLLTCILLFLGLNKQLDLQNLITAIGRYYAKKQDWYQYRREIQKEFIIILGTIIIFSTLLILTYMKNILIENSLAIIGTVFLLFFIILRASTFYHLSFFPDSKSFNGLLELFGIFLIGYCAISAK
jgi:hypothetical protein